MPESVTIPAKPLVPHSWALSDGRLAIAHRTIGGSSAPPAHFTPERTLELLNHLEEHRAAIEAEVRASVGAARWQIVGDEVTRLAASGACVHGASIDPWQARDASAEGLGVLVIDIGSRVDYLPEGAQLHVRVSEDSAYIYHLVQIADGVYVMAVAV